MASRASRALRLITARPWLSVAVAVVLAGGASGIYVLTKHDTTAQAQVTSRLVGVSTGTVRESVSTTGTISPADESDVSFGSSGTVTSVRVSVGDKVRKGEILGTIDTLSLRATLAQDRAALATANAQLASGEDDSSTTSAQLSAEKASVKTARATVTAAKQALTDATLRAPIAGTVATVNVSKGDQAGGSSSSSSSASSSAAGSGNGNGASAQSTASSSSSSSADFVVIGAKKWTVSASVDDTQVGLIAKGDQAQITTDNASGLVFGTVSSVSVLSSGSSGSAAYPVDIAITGSPSGMHDGASATVAIIYKQVSNVLTVANAAIHSDGSSKYVYVSSNGAKVKKAVTTGLSSGGTTQITSGLASGDQVYVDLTTARPSVRGTTGTTNNGNGIRYGGGGFGGGGGGAVPGGGGFGGGNP